MEGGGGSLGAPFAAVSSSAASGTDSPSHPNDRVGVYTPDFAYALNCGYNGEGSYSIDAAHGGPSSGSVNGTVTADLSGTLLCYFHMYWSGPGPQPASADFLVSTQLYAQAGVLECESADAIGGLSATATVTVDAFKETASASVVAGVSSGGVPTVNGFHLVRAAVEPNTGIAEVYVMGTTHWVLSNMVPYATAGKAIIAGGSLVRAGAIPDSRDLTISATVDATNKKVPLLDANGNQTSDANGDPNYTSAPNTRDSNGTMYGDTIYSYHNYVSQVSPPGTYTPPPVDTGTLNWIYFKPNYIGNWHWVQALDQYGNLVTAPDIFQPSTWQWSPSETQDSWDYAQCSMPWAAKYTETDSAPTGQDAPTTYPVSYSATDNTDQAQAGANYVMTVHDPYEANYSDHATYRNKENFKKYPNAKWASSGNDPGKLYDLDVHTETSESIDISLSPAGGLEKWVASALPITLDVSASYEISVGEGTTVKDVPPGYGTYPMSYEVVDYHRGKVDQWGSGGYQGTSPYNLRVHEDPAVGIQPAPLVRMSGAPNQPPG